jgi:hypothetical protein
MTAPVVGLTLSAVSDDRRHWEWNASFLSSPPGSFDRLGNCFRFVGSEIALPVVLFT